jgi:hypothetical protein
VTVVATVFCGHCRDQGKRRAGKLGVVERNSEGAVTWSTMHTPVKAWRAEFATLAAWEAAGRPPGRQRQEALVLSHPGFPGLGVPDTLDVFCATHGYGRVPTCQITTAAGNVYRHLTASG